jgi:hypothetical protein
MASRVGGLVYASSARRQVRWYATPCPAPCCCARAGPTGRQLSPPAHGRTSRATPRISPGSADAKFRRCWGCSARMYFGEAAREPRSPTGNGARRAGSVANVARGHSSASSHAGYEILFSWEAERHALCGLLGGRLWERQTAEAYKYRFPSDATTKPWGNRHVDVRVSALHHAFPSAVATQELMTSTRVRATSVGAMQ